MFALAREGIATRECGLMVAVAYLFMLKPVGSVFNTYEIYSYIFGTCMVVLCAIAM